MPSGMTSATVAPANVGRTWGPRTLVTKVLTIVCRRISGRRMPSAASARNTGRDRAAEDPRLLLLRARVTAATCSRRCTPVPPVGTVTGMIPTRLPIAPGDGGQDGVVDRCPVRAGEPVELLERDPRDGDPQPWLEPVQQAAVRGAWVPAGAELRRCGPKGAQPGRQSREPTPPAGPCVGGQPAT